MSEILKSSRCFDDSIRFCSVSICNHVQIVGASDVLKFHRFPKDEGILKEWIRCCGREDLDQIDMEQLQQNYYICSDHFIAKDYKGKNRVYLRATAVPSQNLPIIEGTIILCR